MRRNLPLRFEFIPYPIWRRKMPKVINTLTKPIIQRFYPLAYDEAPPPDPASMADVLVRYRLLPDMTLTEIHQALLESQAQIENAYSDVTPDFLSTPEAPARIPAQWETMESIIVTWPTIYPPLWDLHSEMVEAIAPVAEAVIIVPGELWAHAAWVYLMQRGNLGTYQNRVKFLVLPIDDIWVRDYGPIVCLDDAGHQIAFSAVYDHLPKYPQTRDNAMPWHWAAYMGMPIFSLNLHTEGGNLLSDGTGTLIMSEQIFRANPKYNRQTLEDYLHTVFQYDKLIITPKLALEHTGHVDLLAKLANANTVLVSAPTSASTAAQLRANITLFNRETNAIGEHYTVFELPTPPLYFNWGAYAIRRSYTNSLIVNGRVLVPIYSLKEDDTALRIYEEAMPDYEIIPIDCTSGINGGGAVHCMTKEVPAKAN
ncbi:MAG: hypothetical protein CUN56_01935 [Phototrophicales bacterium]|nr:MAG: hypothetical protein CUN56_01935 [Phototrophicales bacterium]